MTYFKSVFCLFLLLLSLRIHCHETNESSSQAIAQPINFTPDEPSTSDTLTTTDVPITSIKGVIDTMPFILSDKHKDGDDGDDDDDDSDSDDDDDDKKGGEKKDKKKDDKDDDGNATNTTNPTTTIYSTIYIIATETPTQIYTGTNQPAKQKGQKSDGNEISDPTSSKTTDSDDNDNDDGGGGDSDSGDNNNNNSQTGNSPDQNSEDNINQVSGHSSSYKRLVAALSVIGSIAAIILLFIAFILARRKVNKKKQHPKDYPKDLEMGPCSLPSPPPPPPHRHIPPPPPSLRHSSYRINVSQHHDGESTLIDFGNPFNDPTEEKLRDSVDLVPELPTNLNPDTYTTFRQNQTLSLLTQTTAAEPSAPTEKELKDNPFEQQNEIPLYYSMNQICPTDREQSSTEDDPIMESNTHHQEQTSLLRPQQQIEDRSTNGNYHQPIHFENQGDASDLPPAYTPSATPSAPPLYALPTISRSQITELRRNPSINSSRRHSVSSSILSESRPLSLRRGSGSLAFISSLIS